MDSVDYIGGDFTQADGLETLCHRGDEVIEYIFTQSGVYIRQDVADVTDVFWYNNKWSPCGKWWIEVSVARRTSLPVTYLQQVGDLTKRRLIYEYYQP